MGKLASRSAHLWLSQEDLATIVVNFLLSVRMKDVGYENAKKTLPEFLQELESLPKIKISVEQMEDLLCAVNLRSETLNGPAGFYSPRDSESFEAFIKRIFWYARDEGQKLTFDRDYNVIVHKDKEVES